MATRRPAAKKAAKKKSAKKSTKKTASLSDTPKRGRGRPLFQATEEDKQKVELMIGLGLTLHEISMLVFNPETGKGISVNTLQKHFADEIARGAGKIKAIIAGALFKKAKSHDHPQAAISAMFMMKCRFGWRQEEKHVHEMEGNSGVLIAPASMSPDDWVKAANSKNDKAKPKTKS